MPAKAGHRFQRPIGDHHEDGIQQSQRRAFQARLLPQDGVDAQLLPQLLQNPDATEWPSIEQLDCRTILRHHLALLFLDYAQDTLGKSLQRSDVKLVGSAEVVHDPRHRAAFAGIPGVLGELVVANGRAVGIAALGGAQVHAYLLPA